jgi:hypothetical protein
LACAPDGFTSELPAGDLSIQLAATLPRILQGFSSISLELAPLMLVASDFAGRIETRKQLALTSLTGLCGPLFATRVFTDMVSVATYHS